MKPIHWLDDRSECPLFSPSSFVWHRRTFVGGYYLRSPRRMPPISTLNTKSLRLPSVWVQVPVITLFFGHGNPLLRLQIRATQLSCVKSSFLVSSHFVHPSFESSLYLAYCYVTHKGSLATLIQPRHHRICFCCHRFPFVKPSCIPLACIS